MPFFNLPTIPSVTTNQSGDVQNAIDRNNWQNVGISATAASQDLATALRNAGVSQAEIDRTLTNAGVPSTYAGQTSILPTPQSALPAGTDSVDDIMVTGSRLESDMRVRLRAQPGQAEGVYGPAGPDNILSILHKTGGVLFPYTPTITVEQSVDYKTVDLVHANGDINAYTRTPSVSLSVTGKFTVQNQREGEYLIAVLHFLRTMSKMHFGETDPNAGLPPPILYFHGYGTYMFKGLKVVLKSHSFSLDDTVDYVDVTTPSGGITRVPSMLTVSLSVGVQNTPTEMRKDFNLQDFRTGAMMRDSKGWI